MAFRLGEAIGDGVEDNHPLRKVLFFALPGAPLNSSAQTIIAAVILFDHARGKRGQEGVVLVMSGYAAEAHP
jgi:hypothetical protein